MTAPDLPHIVLLGAGHAQIHLLARLAKLPARRRNAMLVTLVAPYPVLVYARRIAGLVAGRYTLAEVSVSLDRLIHSGRIDYIQGRALEIDTARRRVLVQTRQGGRDLHYDLLGVDTGAVMDRHQLEQRIPGARDHGLFVRPMEALPALWDRLRARTNDIEGEGTGRPAPTRIAVVGGGAGGCELALALRARLPLAEIALIEPRAGGPADLPRRVQRRVARWLNEAGVTTVPGACSALDAQSLHLADGRSLPCDAALFVTGPQPPAWLGRAGLALDGGGFLAVNRWQQSLSHPAVFAAGDVASRVDQRVPRNAVQAIAAGPVYAANLLAAAQGKPLRGHTPPGRASGFFDGSNGRAIAWRGAWVFQGEWVARWKNAVDRRFLRTFGGTENSSARHGDFAPAGLLEKSEQSR